MPDRIDALAEAVAENSRALAELRVAIERAICARMEYQFDEEAE